MRINPRLIDKLVSHTLNLQAYFTVGILVVIVCIIFIKGVSNCSLPFMLTYPEDMGPDSSGLFSLLSSSEWAGRCWREPLP
ncbi:MAG: hypothetical protein NTX06_03555 [Proteobacteria bacterium]|nr:hypothetical protein [Pseudomonadota bacterium]